ERARSLHERGSGSDRSGLRTDWPSVATRGDCDAGVGAYGRPAIVQLPSPHPKGRERTPALARHPGVRTSCTWTDPTWRRKVQGVRLFSPVTMSTVLDFSSFFQSLWNRDPFPWQPMLADRAASGEWPKV